MTREGHKVDNKYITNLHTSVLEDVVVIAVPYKVNIRATLGIRGSKKQNTEGGFTCFKHAMTIRAYKQL